LDELRAVDFRLPLRWIAYAWHCKGPNRIHSPFVYDLYYHHILDHSRQYYAFDALHKLREALKTNSSTLAGQEPGAGSRSGKALHARKVNRVAQRALQPEREARMLFRLITWQKPKAVLELGTSLGLTALYLHKAAPEADFTTIEGHEGTAQFAAALFEKNQAGKIRLLNQNFEAALHRLRTETLLYDTVVLDGDHRYEAVCQLAETIKPLLSAHSVVVVDDIRWSAGMWKAWKQLRNDPFWEVRIDLGKIGLLIRRPGQTPQHFVLRYPF
jgi:predicted O-methyltransferase YrrM